MARFTRYDRFWINVTIVLSLVVMLIGFPAFQWKLGFPASLVWTLAVVGSVWLTYLIRAYLWSDRNVKKR